MNVLHMSILAAVLIIMVLLIRLLAIKRLPRKTFLVLWGLVLFRLLIPVSIPLPFNVHTLLTVTDRAIGTMTDAMNRQITNPSWYDAPFYIPSVDGCVSGEAPAVATQNPSQVSIFVGIWAIGMIGLALFFIITHMRNRKEYKGSLPIENDYVNGWLKEQKLMRSLQVRYTDRINAPMTYGIWKPVILFPKTTDWTNEVQLQYILTHELTHIKRFDLLTKGLFAAALCVHWFNPLVWAMYILANRDIEFACDEAVVWTFGEESKSAYVLTLIGLEERKSGFPLLCNNFAKNAIDERIESIMKLKKRSAFGAILAVFMVSVMTLGVMAFAANGSYEEAVGGGQSVEAQSVSGNGSNYISYEGRASEIIIPIPSNNEQYATLETYDLQVLSGAELLPMTSEREEQVQQVTEFRTNLLYELEWHLENYDYDGVSQFSSNVEGGLSGAELLPITPERQEQVQKVLESRINIMRAAFAGEDVTPLHTFFLPGETLFVRYNNTNFRVSPTGVSLGQVHAGTQVTLIHWRFVDGHFWEFVHIEDGVNEGREGYIRNDLLRR